MADFSKPDGSGLWSNILTQIRSARERCALMFDGGAGDTNLATNTKRIDASDGQVYNWDGSAWISLGFLTNLIDEDDMSTDSETRPPSQQSVKAYVGALPAVIDEDDFSTDSATRPPSQQSVKAYVGANAGGVEVLTGTAAVSAMDSTIFRDTDIHLENSYSSPSTGTLLVNGCTVRLFADNGFDAFRVQVTNGGLLYLGFKTVGTTLRILQLQATLGGKVVSGAMTYGGEDYDAATTLLGAYVHTYTGAKISLGSVLSTTSGVGVYGDSKIHCSGLIFNGACRVEGGGSLFVSGDINRTNPASLQQIKVTEYGRVFYKTLSGQANPITLASGGISQVVVV